MLALARNAGGVFDSGAPDRQVNAAIEQHDGALAIAAGRERGRAFLSSLVGAGGSDASRSNGLSQSAGGTTDLSAASRHPTLALEEIPSCPHPQVWTRSRCGDRLLPSSKGASIRWQTAA